MPVGPCVPVAPGGTPDDAVDRPGAAPELALTLGGPGPGKDSGWGCLVSGGTLTGSDSLQKVPDFPV